MFNEDGVGKVIALRIASLVDADSAWHNYLWQVGTLRAMSDCMALADSNTTEARVQYVINTARRIIKNDPVLLGRRRGQVLDSMPKKADQFRSGTHSYFVLQHEIGQLESEYFSLWQRFIASIDECEDPISTKLDLNLISCYIAGHLRWCGFSDKWILKHCNYHIKHRPEDSTLEEMLTSAARVAQNGPGEYTFLVPLPVNGEYDLDSEPPWLSKSEFEGKFAEYMPGEEMPKNAGGLIFQAPAIEKYRATELFAKFLQDALARGRLVEAKLELKPDGGAWMHPGSNALDLPDLASTTFIPLESLAMGGDRWKLQKLRPDVEAGLDLLSNIGAVSMRSACVTTWAMVETMFADASDFGSLADISDRPADLLTCMYVTDLFDKLASSHMMLGDDELSVKLNGADMYRRVELTVDSLLAARTLCVDAEHGPILLQQARNLAVETGRFNVIRAEFSESIRRLYGSRNEIVHAGVIEPYGMGENLRVAAKLLAAVLDESLRHSQVSREPVALVAAKCRWLLNRVEIGADIAGLTTFHEN
ncbi:hypothetical protein [Nocardia sp. NPDC051833]|uniref:hypothetical protein n=1 Tax=Nocardia sp. NPDC051833 TaxID=3155674 RepID=UPI00341C8038